LHFCLTKHHRRTEISGELYLRVFLTFALESGGRATSRDDKKTVLRRKLYGTLSWSGYCEEDKIIDSCRELNLDCWAVQHVVSFLDCLIMYFGCRN